MFLVGGLTPRYLVAARPPEVPAHAGTLDVDIVIDLQILADTAGVVFCVKSEWLSRINLIGVGQDFPHCSVFSGWTVLHRALGCSGPE